MLINSLHVTSTEHKVYKDPTEAYITLCFNTSQGKECFDFVGNDIPYFRKYFNDMKRQGIPAAIRIQFEDKELRLLSAKEQDIQEIINIFNQL